MTRKVDPLDTALAGADVPKAPEGLASRIALDVTRLAQEKPVSEGIAASEGKADRTTFTGKRLLAACAATFAVVAGLAAYSLAGGQGVEQRTYVAAGEGTGGEMGTGPSHLVPLADEKSEVALQDALPEKALRDQHDHDRSSAAQPEEADALAVEDEDAQELAIPMLLNPLEPHPEPALATHNKAVQGPALDDGTSGSASVYGPPGGEGMGIVGGAPNMPAPRSGGAKSGMGPPPPPR